MTTNILPTSRTKVKVRGKEFWLQKGTPVQVLRYQPFYRRVGIAFHGFIEEIVGDTVWVTQGGKMIKKTSVSELRPCWIDTEIRTGNWIWVPYAEEERHEKPSLN